MSRMDFPLLRADMFEEESTARVGGFLRWSASPNLVPWRLSVLLPPFTALNVSYSLTIQTIRVWGI